MPGDKVYVIGIGAGGAMTLSTESRRYIEEAEIVFGGQRLLEMFPEVSVRKVPIKNNLSKVVGVIKSDFHKKRIVVLASGDPNFHGIGKRLVSELGKSNVEIIPNVSCLQLAFARIKENWDDAVMTSVHSKPIEDVVDVVRTSYKIGILTDNKHTPGEIARVLQEHGIENCQAYVCQDLGTDRENILATDLYSLKERDFSPLNVLILVRKPPEIKSQQLLGIPEDNFHRWREGFITKLEVRAVSLARMALTESSIVWDVGAGSGAISVEASLLAGKGSIFAIEKSAQAVTVIRKNVRKFGRHNISVVRSSAPDGLEELPDPDTVFIGGSGGHLTEILTVAARRLKPGGRIVVNVATLETLQLAVEGLRSHKFTFEVALVNIARNREISGLTRLEALNPVFVLTGWRESEGGR